MTMSVLMSIYGKDAPLALRQCLESLVAQKLPASQIVIVQDGPLGSELQSVIHEHRAKLPIEAVPLPHNVGLGGALRLGIERCRFDVIARMDADDICAPNRFEKQMAYLRAHPEVDVVGASIREFDSDPSHALSERRLPTTHDAIAAYARRRNPVNHVTVMFRKAAVLAAGSYRSLGGFEDYDLWVRMLMLGARFSNMEESLVFVRCGNGMQLRRGGLRYLGRELKLFRSFHAAGFINSFELFQNALLRAPARLLPASIRTGIYRRFLRRTVSAERALATN
jgi:glycosyltransferase involved in cell wall biosynthesis